MALEIERRFLVANDSWRDEVERSLNIQQGYLSTDPNRVIRVRLQADEAFLTVKTKAVDLTRAEYEYPIPLTDGQALLRLCQENTIDKTRHLLHYQGKLWEIDVFSARHRGLVIAEIELQSSDESIALPSWLGEEVSGNYRYSNSYLSQHPDVDF